MQLALSQLLNKIRVAEWKLQSESNKNIPTHYKNFLWKEKFWFMEGL